MAMKRPLGNYGLGWVLLACFLLFWVGQTATGWKEFKAEQAAQGQTAEVFGDDGYIWSWGEATLENWQSEFLQLFAMVTLTSFLIFKGSAESRDSDEEMKQALERIERRLTELDRAREGQPARAASISVPGD
jgi:hypothetical protein